MKDIVSKELLSEVLGLTNPIDEISTMNYFANTFYVSYTNKAGDNINIYDLVFNKMITWAFKKHYYLNVDKTCTEIWKDNKQVHLTSSSKKPLDSKMYESVILACEWIYNKEIK